MLNFQTYNDNLYYICDEHSQTSHTCYCESNTTLGEQKLEKVQLINKFVSELVQAVKNKAGPLELGSPISR